MTDAAMILVIILSIFLALFLLLGIVLAVILINISKKINNIATNVDSTTQHFSQAATKMSRVAGPAAIAKLMIQQITYFKKKRK
jgi:regulatory protein YycI of two-component signal transduction system YycFG